MFYNIIFSPTGGTKRVADILGRGLAAEWTAVDLCDPRFAPVELTSEGAAIIAVPSFGGRVPPTAARRMEKVRGNGARAVLVCVYGNRAYDNTLAEMKDIAERAGFRPVAVVSAVAEHSMVRRLAAGRPDKSDEASLNEMALKIAQKLAADNLTPVQVPGSVPDKPASILGGKMAPKATADCTRCGVCAAKCPVEAINPQTLEADKSKCIACMRCVSVCSSKARRLNIVIESLGGVALGVLCSQRKENELFI
ncbi:MAG: 4Fe-4S binding protein [Oscillospiraceae bacterium]|nr:4Fe-4S binding protein [Oscillospiraceae bacterium]